MMNSMESTAVDTELARVVRLGCGAREHCQLGGSACHRGDEKPT